jgi:hypothetical protein
MTTLSRVPFQHVADRHSDLAERIGPVDGRCDLAGRDELWGSRGESPSLVGEVVAEREPSLATSDNDHFVAVEPGVHHAARAREG